jgi:predicted nuclease of restriction endonuclease-like RecB superfamily
MLASPLLRIRTTKNGLVFPLFCTRDEEVDLAERLIQEFETSWRNKERKSELDNRISVIESECNRDYKLVRGLCTLLERRCKFESASKLSITTADDSQQQTRDISAAPANESVLADPIGIRKALFEESSRKGFALTDLERQEIIDSVASRLHLSTDIITSAMWSDLDDNLILYQFDRIDAKSLVGWYNLSLIQTLLFNCTKLEFSVSGGINWKRILRSVKRLGLMYHLQEQEWKENNYGGCSDGNDDNDEVYDNNNNDRRKRERRVVCYLEGPLSLFRLTDRYGTALAKLLPMIVINSKADGWHIDAWILRKTMEGKRALYEFKLSDAEAPQLLTDPFYNYHFSNNNNRNEPPAVITYSATSLPSPPPPSSSFSSSSSFSEGYFDSAVEEKFARRFEAAASSTGWRLIREPDPLIVSGGKALIPDFMFEKYGKRVYLEIVGFWTPEYLERKLKKLADVIIMSRENSSKKDVDYASMGSSKSMSFAPAATTTRITSESKTAVAMTPVEKIELFIALNKDLACSNAVLSSLSFHLIPKERLILYGNDSVPVRPILDYLKSIDKEITENSISDTNLKAEFDRNKDVVSVNEITVRRRIKRDEKDDDGGVDANNNNDSNYYYCDSNRYYPLPPEVRLKLALRDYGNDYIEVSGTHLISKTKAESMKALMANIDRFSEACTILAKNEIPESCHAELVSKLGYDVLWQTMDPSTAAIVKRK